MPADEGSCSAASSEEDDFRAAARAWLEANAPAPLPDDVSQSERLTAARAWQRRLFDHGWAGISWPKDYGGLGLPRRSTTIFQEEEAKVLDWTMVKGPFNVAFHMAAPAVLAFGAEPQRDAHIPALLRGEELWCQLFSEPDAGSDLANLATRATRDGDRYIVNGQKVWSSYAHYANFGLLLARTDPDAPKHRGISYFVLDMTLPGISVRPLRQMTGTSEFNEVYFDNVEVPAGALLGDENSGWAIAHSTLSNERQYLGAGILTQPKFPELLQLARTRGRTHEPGVRDMLVACYMREQLLRYMALRIQSADPSRPLDATPSLMKLAQGTHVVTTAADTLRLDSAAGLGAIDDDHAALRVRDTFLMSPAMRIGGGTDDIQKQTVAERVLGLPRDPDPTRQMPWREVRQGRPSE